MARAGATSARRSDPGENHDRSLADGARGGHPKAELAGTAAESSAPDEGRGRPEPPRRRRRLGLRARVTTTFALGALVLSGALASITYISVRSSIIDQQESSLTHEALGTAEALSGALRHPVANYAVLLNDYATARNSESLLVRGHQSYPSSPSALDLSLLPRGLRALVRAGDLADQVVVESGSPVLIVGVPIKSAGSEYFQLFTLGDISRTLHVLFASLLLAALVTTLGGAIVGRWAASRALRPLHETAEAALAIAEGRLDTRLESDRYADLSVLTSAFNSMADELQTRIEREVRFTSDVNHELRSPLTTLATSLSVVQARRDELPERARQALDLLSAEVGRFRRLVDDLLEISRLDAGLGDWHTDEVALGALVRHTVAASPPPVFIEIPEAAEHRRVLVDKRRFERIVANLLENAERYAGGATRVTVETDARWGRVAVEDRGPGIPAEERNRVFDRFSRGTSGRRRGTGEGTGLGLAIVAEHARQLGGHVYLEPNGACGARFVIELPLLPEEEE